MIDKTGHIKLSDFGISSQYGKQDRNYQNLLEAARQYMIKNEHNMILSTSDTKSSKKNKTVLGSLEYIAPEVLYGQQPTYKSDFWSLGIMIYEMAYGFTPFTSDSKAFTAIQIVNWKKSLRFPTNTRHPVTLISLLSGLLCDVENRFGFEELINHPFFQGFDFEHPFNNKPPMHPNLSDPLDTSFFSNFDNIPREELRGAESITDLADIAFKGYTYKAKRPSNVLSRLKSHH